MTDHARLSSAAANSPGRYMPARTIPSWARTPVDSPLPRCSGRRGWWSILGRAMRPLAWVLVIGLLALPVSAESVVGPPPGGCVSVVRDPGNLPFLDLREDGSFRVGAARETLDRAPLLAGTWAFTDHHLMLVDPEGGCPTAPRLDRTVAVFVGLEGALYPAMSSTATQAVVSGNPQVGCPAYDGAAIEVYRPIDPGSTRPA